MKTNGPVSVGLTGVEGDGVIFPYDALGLAGRSSNVARPSASTFSGVTAPPRPPAYTHT